MANPTAAMLVIGDEILSGRTRDSNTHHLAGRLTAHGIDLREVRVVADDTSAIVAAVRALCEAYDHLFTSGGIGPTHDDITADSIAAALGVRLGVREDARDLLAEHYRLRGTKLNAARLRMARIPDGAELIGNPISAAPGFSIRNVHVMAGVPQIFEAMLEGLLPRLAGGAPLSSSSILVERGEGDIAGPLSDLARNHPALSFGSYPFAHDGSFGVNVVVRGTDQTELDAAISALRAAFPETAA